MNSQQVRMMMAEEQSEEGDSGTTVETVRIFHDF